MSDAREGGETDAEGVEMPPPPDLSSLFKAHSAGIEAACQKAGAAFSAIGARDQDLGTLVTKLGAEIEQVFTIAAAAKSPQLALASIPPVLALANTAFAAVPATDQKTQTALKDAFAPFSG